MKVGDIVKWSWHVNTDWAKTDFLGTVVNSRLYKTDREKIIVFEVLDNTGDVIRVREDEPSLEVISESR